MIVDDEQKDAARGFDPRYDPQFQRGYRMDDLRRLVRQYHRTQDKVFPSGNFTTLGSPAGQYGSQVAFPVPDYEKINPNFTGCLDNNA